MVHRKEGEFLGELGMVGFANCHFWFGKTGFHPLYQVVKENAIEIASNHNTVRKFQNFSITQILREIKIQGLFFKTLKLPN